MDIKCNYKYRLIKELKFWIHTERSLKSNQINHTLTIHDYKIAAYKKVLDQIQKISTIRSWEDLKDVKGIGKSIKSKLEPIFAAGASGERLPTQISNNDIEKVYGVGPITALKLMAEHNILTIEDLHLEHSRNPNLLNRVQKIGLKYYNDLQQPISRVEMDKHKKLLHKILDVKNKIDKDLIFSLVGSYRRKLKQSSDIDLLVSVKRTTTTADRADILKTIVGILECSDYIKDVLALGDKKFMGIAKLPKHKYFRRIDILITGQEEYPFALLYFTGSKEFNIEFRNNVKDHDVVLNEYGIFSKSGKRLNLNIHTELDIFNYFNVQYIEPEHRI